MEWYYILIIVLSSLLVWLTLSTLLYKQFFKRFYDILLSGLAIIVLSPILLILTIVGAIAMKGNPFFVQLRPGKIGKDGKEKIFRLIKFRSMTNEKDENGNLLPDKKRLKGYGKFLRSTSLDELPELFNILKGDMAIIGPRPLLIQYLSVYSDEQRKRHLVLPGLTGYAQVHGRNSITWTEKFKLDIYYVEHISLFLDLRIAFDTVLCVLKHDGINQEGNATVEDFNGNN